MKNLKITKAIFIALMVLMFMIIPFSKVNATEPEVGMETPAEDTETPSGDTETPAEEATNSEESNTNVEVNWDFDEGTPEIEVLPTELPKGAKIELNDIKVSVPAGKVLAGFLVNGVKYELTDTITVTENMTIKAVYADATETKTENEFEYKILDGDNQNFVVDSNKEFSVRANGDVSKFVSLAVDKKEVDSKNYTIKSGSTIAILNNDYLNTLEAGAHTLTFKYTDGEVSSNFTIAKAEATTATTESKEATTEATTETTKTNPTTGDKIVVWVAVLGLATVVTVASAKLRRK